jgi:hypothetical protein
MREENICHLFVVVVDFLLCHISFVFHVSVTYRDDFNRLYIAPSTVALSTALPVQKLRSPTGSNR